MNITNISAQNNFIDFNTNNKSNGTSFSNMLTSALSEVNSEQVTSEFHMEQIATGKTENLQKAILQIDQASMSLSLAMEIQNKLLSGFKEVINTQV